jgi:indolepyruvate ferredoxin oxidoreductase
LDEPARLLSGIDAIVHIPFEQQRLDREAGLRTTSLFSGYPGSPLGGVDLALERLSDAEDVLVHVPAVNEELAAAAVWGSQLPRMIDRRRLDGVVGFWYGKSPGADRSGDVFRHANFMGTSANGGAVAIVGDDPSAKSSTLPNDSQPLLAGLQMPILAPATVGEVLEFGLHAVALSRFCGLWVGLKVVTDLADGFAAVRVADHVPKRIVPELVVDGEPWHFVQPPSLSNVVSVVEEGSIHLHRLPAAQLYCRSNGLNRIVEPAPEARIGILAVGHAYVPVAQALVDLGNPPGVRVLKVGMPFPLEPTVIRAFAEGLDEILVIEEKRPFVEIAVRDILYRGPHQPDVVGKLDGDGMTVIPPDGELTADRLRPVLEHRLRSLLPERPPSEGRRVLPVTAATSDLPLPARPPAYCSGCPHNRSTTVPEGVVVGGGVGCHSIVYLEDRHRDVDMLPLTPMGAEGALWLGAAPFAKSGHLLQNLGDGTFSHSGSLAVRACVAAGVNITFKVLYNSAVAMTGGQDVAGSTPVPDLTRELEAMGVMRTIVCADDPTKYGRHPRWAADVSVWSRDRLREAETALAATSGVTVLVYDQRCAAEARRLWRNGRLEEPRTRVVINEAVCEGCGDCQVKSNCLSVRPVETELGRKTKIHQPSCNHDLSCLDGDCPSFVTVQTGTRPASRALPAPPDDLPYPAEALAPTQFAVYLVGIGGAGVVTANRLLADVATREGWAVAGLDQTGLSQKAGTVTSHLRLSRGAEPAANVVGAAACDVFFAFDALAAVQPKHLARIERSRTSVVVNAGLVPTASMIASGGDGLPEVEPIVSRLENAAATVLRCDADAATQALVGDDMPANVFAIGAAFQAGLLPFSAATFEAAILEGVPSPARTLSAFRWGRASISRPDLLHAALSPRPDSTRRSSSPATEAAARALLRQTPLAGPTLAASAWRVGDLIDYQDARVAQRYLRMVEQGWDAERRVAGDHTELSEALAFGFYKLLAYKDEYEVARLHLDTKFDAEIKTQLGGSDRRYLLHPPMLRALGWQKKVAFPQGLALPMFHALHAGRRLRGTGFDPFGYTAIRRLERALVDEYAGWMHEVLPTLESDTYDQAVELARLPDMVRGYEGIKARSVEKYHERAAEVLQQLRAAP